MHKISDWVDLCKKFEVENSDTSAAKNEKKDGLTFANLQAKLSRDQYVAEIGAVED